MKKIGRKRKEGDLITPIGKYKIEYILYRKDKLEKFRLESKNYNKKDMGWCNDPSSKSYNRLIKYLQSIALKNFTKRKYL